MRFKLSGILLLLCNLVALSQSCTSSLSGQTIDLHDDTSLAGAVITVSGTERSVLSDLDGTYLLTDLCDGPVTIGVSHPSCATRYFQVSVSGASTQDFMLEHHLNELNEVIITGVNQNVDNPGSSRQRLQARQLEQYSNGSLGDALNSLSGVSSLSTGATVVKPMINGLHSSRVVILNNGVRMEDQEWGVEHAPNIDINAAGSITVVKGASGLQYSGDAVGGLILVEPARVPVSDTLYGRILLSGSTNGRGGTIVSQITKANDNGWYASLQASAKRYGDREAPDYVLSNTGIADYGINLRGGLNRFRYGVEGWYSLVNTEIGILRASHLGGALDQVRAINSDRPLIIEDFTYDIDEPSQQVQHHTLGIKGFSKIKGIGRLEASYDYQRNDRQEFDIRRGSDADRAALDLLLQTHSASLGLESRLEHGYTLKTGLQASYQDNFADPSTGVRRLIPDYERTDLAAYGIVSKRFSEKLILEGGARFDYRYVDAQKFYRTSFWESRGYDVEFADLVVEDFGNQILVNPKLRFYNPSFTLGGRYTLHEDLDLHFNYALATRAPNPSELFSEGLHHSASRIELGDLRFDSEQAQKVSLTLKQTNARLTYSVSPYVNSIRDFMLIEPTGVQQTIRGNFQVWEYRQTQALLTGVDVDATYVLIGNTDVNKSTLQFDHQFSFIKGYDRTRDTPLINLPAVNVVNGLRYSILSTHNLQAGLRSEYTWAQNEFPDNNFEVFVPDTQTTEVVDVSTPPDAYLLLHLDASMDLKLSAQSTLTIGARVHNLLDNSYRNYLNRQRYYADDLGRNITFTARVNY